MRLQQRLSQHSASAKKYRRLANTGVYVSELCLGAMTFGTEWEMIGALGQKDADALVNRSIDAGINFFDTSPMYGGGQSEFHLRLGLEVIRNQAFITTKVRLQPYTLQWVE